MIHLDTGFLIRALVRDCEEDRRLRGWLEEDAQGRRLRRHLTDAAADWQAAGRDPGELDRGARLGAWLAEQAAGGAGEIASSGTLTGKTRETFLAALKSLADSLAKEPPARETPP